MLDFPFSDLSQVKRRPALVVAVLPGSEVVLSQITSRTDPGRAGIELESTDFVTGGLSRTSKIRPEKLFTVDSRIIAYRAGHVTAAKLGEVRGLLVALFRDS